MTTQGSHHSWSSLELYHREETAQVLSETLQFQSLKFYLLRISTPIQLKQQQKNCPDIQLIFQKDNGRKEWQKIPAATPLGMGAY